MYKYYNYDMKPHFSDIIVDIIWNERKMLTNKAGKHIVKIIAHCLYFNNFFGFPLPRLCRDLNRNPKLKHHFFKSFSFTFTASTLTFSWIYFRRTWAIIYLKHCHISDLLIRLTEKYEIKVDTWNNFHGIRSGFVYDAIQFL